MNYLLGLHGEHLEDRIDEQIKGVGMIRSEYLCRKIEEYFTLETCRNSVKSYVSQICEIFTPSEVWYRTSELITPEVNVLRGADYIIEEKYYTLGLRGTRRGLAFPDTFALELSNISKVAKQYSNLNVLFPYIKDAFELEQCIDLLNKFGFKNKFGIMAEIPSAIITIDDFIGLGISNITVGVNDLTTLVLGTYRDSEYHNCTHPAVIRLIEYLVNKASGKNIEVNVAGNVNKELCHICENIGVDNFIVNYPLLPDILGIDNTRLSDIHLLKDIKALTKQRRQERAQCNTENC